MTPCGDGALVAAHPHAHTARAFPSPHLRAHTAPSWPVQPPRKPAHARPHRSSRQHGAGSLQPATEAAAAAFAVTPAALTRPCGPPCTGTIFARSCEAEDDPPHDPRNADDLPAAARRRRLHHTQPPFFSHHFNHPQSHSSPPPPGASHSPPCNPLRVYLCVCLSSWFILQ